MAGELRLFISNKYRRFVQPNLINCQYAHLNKILDYNMLIFEMASM